MKRKHSRLSVTSPRGHLISPHSLIRCSFIPFVLCLSLPFSPSIHVAATSIELPGKNITADFSYVVDTTGIKESFKDDIWLHAGQIFVLATKTTEDLKFQPTDMTTHGYAYKDSECKLNEPVELKTLFPNTVLGDLWMKLTPSNEDSKKSGYTRIYRFQNPPADRLPSSLVEFCLLVSSQTLPSSGKNVRVNSQEGQTRAPTVTLVFHSGAFSLPVGVSLFAAIFGTSSFFLVSL